MAHSCCCISEGRTSTEHYSYTELRLRERGPLHSMRSLSQPSKPAWGAQSNPSTPCLFSNMWLLHWPQKSLTVTSHLFLQLYRAAHMLTANRRHSASKPHCHLSSTSPPLVYPNSCCQLCPPTDLGLLPSAQCLGQKQIFHSQRREAQTAFTPRPG